MTTMVRRPLPPRGPGQLGPRDPRGGQAAPSAAGGISGQDVIRILRRRWKMILGFLVGFTVVAVSGTVVWRIMWPEYTAMAHLRVNPPKESLFIATPYRNADMLDRFKQNVTQMARYPSVLRRTLETEEVQDTLWFRRLRKNDPEWIKAMRELAEEIGVTSIPESDLIRITMSMYCSSGREKEQLPTIVNQVTDALRNEVNSSQKRDRDRRVEMFQTRRDEMRQQRRALQTQITNKLRTTEVPAMRRQVDALSIEVGELIKTNNALLTQKADMEKGLQAMMRQRREGTLATNPMVMRALEADPILRGLQADLTSSGAMMEIVQSKYGKDHQQRKTLVIRIKGLRREIESYRANLIQNNITSLLALYEQELTKAIDLLMDNTERLDGLQQSRRDLNTTLMEVEGLEKEAEQLIESIAALETKLTDLKMVRQDDLPAVIVARADVPIEPSGPNLLIWITAGVAVGLSLGVGLALLLELTDTSVKTPTDITNRAELPLLAMIPHADDLDDEIDDYRVACLKGDQSMVAEAFRDLWTNLQFSGPLEKRRSLLITSASPYDGRTCIAVNLAATIAQSGRRVLLVDTNFRRPAVGGLFPSSLDVGLSDALSGQSPWRECVQQTGTPNLSVLVAGKMPPNPIELLGSELSATILGEMREAYDQVIFDSAPLLLISDAKVLATHVDGVVVVVRAGVNTYGIVQRCRRNLVDLGAHIVGGVLNGVRTTVGGYLQKNYDAFHEYQEVDV